MLLKGKLAFGNKMVETTLCFHFESAVALYKVAKVREKSYCLKWQYDQIFSLRFFCQNSSYSPNNTYYASKNEFAKRFLEETGPL